jgi:hypothetical protein
MPNSVNEYGPEGGLTSTLILACRLARRASRRTKMTSTLACRLVQNLRKVRRRILLLLLMLLLLLIVLLSFHQHLSHSPARSLCFAIVLVHRRRRRMTRCVLAHRRRRRMQPRSAAEVEAVHGVLLREVLVELAVPPRRRQRRMLRHGSCGFWHWWLGWRPDVTVVKGSRLRGSSGRPPGSVGAAPAGQSCGFWRWRCWLVRLRRTSTPPRTRARGSAWSSRRARQGLATTPTLRRQRRRAATVALRPSPCA